jgi:hypothetical protein
VKRIPARLTALVAVALVLSSLVLPSWETPAVAAVAAPGRVSGVVRDETGAALAGADVRLSTPSGPLAGAATTDAGGNYSISVATGLYDVSVAVTDAAGPWTARVNNMPVWSDTPLDLAVVRPDAPPAPAPDPTGPSAPAAGATADPAPGSGVTWQGRVLDPQGLPVQPRQFRLEPAAGAPGGTLDVGGPDGAFTFTGPAGRYDLSLATDLGPWGGGATSGPDDGLLLSAAVDLTMDRSDDLTLPDAGTADVVVAAADGHKATDPLGYSADTVDPVDLASGVGARAAVHDTIAADGSAHYGPLLFGRSAVTFAVPHDPQPLPVTATMEPGDRLAIVLGDRTTPPGVPQDVSATAGDGKVKVTWNPPAFDGGSPVTGYVVTASHGGSNFKASFPATASSGTIRGLVNGSDYTVTVMAKNAKGPGPASEPMTVVLDGSGTTVTPPPGDGTGGPGTDPVGGAGAGDGSGSGATQPSSGSGRSGYWLLDADGAVYAFGDAAPQGDASASLATTSGSAAGSRSGPAATRAVDLEPTPSGRGYWILDSQGRIHPFGDAGHFGDVIPARLGAGEEPASLSATPSGAGYWVFTNRGRALAFGDAAFLGDMTGTTLNGPVLDSVATPSGHGYYMVASDGGIFAFGDARFAGSMGGKQLHQPIVGITPSQSDTGYWLIASDGGVFAFDAPFRGSMGGRRLNRPVRGMVRYGDGYLMVAEDGGIFTFSDRLFTGSLGARPPAGPIVAVAAPA